MVGSESFSLEAPIAQMGIPNYGVEWDGSHARIVLLFDLLDQAQVAS